MLSYKWVTQGIGLLMELGACTLYAVPLYANALRQAAGLSQAQIGVVFSAGDFGLFFGAVNGYIYDKTGPRISSITLMFTLALGYGAVLFVLKGYIPTHPWWLLVIIYFIIGQGSNMTNCVAITTNVRNFKPSQKGTVVGTLKMNFGLGVIVYSLLYRYVLNDMEAFFKFVIIALPVLGLLGVAFMKHVPREGESGHQPVSRAHESTTELTSPKHRSPLTARGSSWRANALSPSHAARFNGNTSSSTSGPLPAAPNGSTPRAGRTLMQASIPEQPPRSASASPRAMARVQAALLAEEGRLGKASGAPHKHPPVRRGSSLMLHDGAALDKDLETLQAANDAAPDIYGSEINCNGVFWTLWCCYGVAQGAALLIINNLASMMLAIDGTCNGDNSAVEHKQFLAVLLLGVANSLGRLLTGLFTDFIGDRHTPLTFCCIVCFLACTALAMVWADDTTTLIIEATVAALWFGSANTLSACMLAQLFGTAHYGSNFGKFTTAPGVFALILNAVGGALYDSRTNCPATTSDGVDKCFGDGCYTSTFFFAFGVCAVSTVVAVIVLMDWSVYFPSCKPRGVGKTKSKPKSKRSTPAGKQGDDGWIRSPHRSIQSKNHSARQSLLENSTAILPQDDALVG